MSVLCKPVSCGLNDSDPGACNQPAIGGVGMDADPLCWLHRMLARARAFPKEGREEDYADDLRLLKCVVPVARKEQPGSGVRAKRGVLPRMVS